MPLSLCSNLSSTSFPIISNNCNKTIKTPLRNPLSLLRSFVQNGNIRDAQKLFDKMPKRSQASWTILMNGYIQHGNASDSLTLFTKMINELSLTGLQPDRFMLSVGLKICALLGLLSFGMELHSLALKMGYLENDLFVANALVNMYAHCKFINYAKSVFVRIRKHDLVSWSSMLNGFVINGYEDEAVCLFLDMVNKGIVFDCYILSIGLKAGLGIHVHCYMIKMGLSSSFLNNSLMDFYGNIGDLDSTRKVFNKMLNKDLVSWNTIISCHVRNHCDKEALLLVSEMMHCNDSCSKCDDFTLGSILNAVTNLGSRNYGKETHAYSIRSGFSLNSYVNSALLDTYVKCNYHDMNPVKLFMHIQTLGAEIDEFMVTSILKSCSLDRDIKAGKMFHSCVIKYGMIADPFVISSLIDMYSKCESLNESVRVFSRIRNPNALSWSSIIAAHCYNEDCYGALQLYREMHLIGIKANEFTYTSIILACIALENIRFGREIHCSIVRNGYNMNAPIVNVLINLYLEFGLVHEAMKLCSSINVDEIHWNSMIEAFGKANYSSRILRVFHKIHLIFGQLNHKSVSLILHSCEKLRDLSMGMQVHAYIIKRGIVNDPNTSNSLINMYSKCGILDYAVEAFSETSDKNSEIWTSIISAYVDHNHPSKALVQFIDMIKKGKSPNSNTFLYILNACRKMGLIDEAFRVFTLMIEVYRIDPSVEIYSIMVDILNCVGMFREAEHFIEYLVPFKPNAFVWKLLLSSSRSCGNTRVAKLAEEKLLGLQKLVG